VEGLDDARRLPTFAADARATPPAPLKDLAQPSVMAAVRP